jgi:hypothetical protein
LIRYIIKDSNNKFYRMDLNNSLNNFELKIPDIIKYYDEEKQNEIYNYLKQLDTLERKAYIIAFEHLGSSFNIYKSNGFKEWKNKK